MNKKKKRKAHYFENGGYDKSNLGFNKDNFNNGLFNGAISAVGGAAGNAISGGLSSGAGNAISGLGDIASAIPGPWGAVASAGLKTIGGLVNAAFGSQINEQAVAKAKQANNAVANISFDAASVDDLIDQSDFGVLGNLSKSDIGKDGWFSNKARNLTKRLNEQRAAANRAAVSNFANAAANIEDNLQDNALANYAANGGPLNMRYTGVMSPFGSRFDDGGPLSYDQYYNIMNKVAQKNYKNWGFNTSDEALVYALNDNTYDYKGYYNKYPNSNANAITHWTDEFKTVYHPTFSNESVYSGKKSEFNPKGLVGGYWKGETFIPAKWQKRKKAFGGKLSTNGAEWSNGLTVIGNGGTHEENPLEGVQMGVDPQGIPNLVEEGEVIFNDYVFSDRMKVPKAVRQKYKLRGKKDISFAEAAKKLSKESEERPNDPISKAGLEAALNPLIEAQEAERQKKEVKKARKQFNNLSPEEQLGLMSSMQGGQGQQGIYFDKGGLLKVPDVFGNGKLPPIEGGYNVPIMNKNGEIEILRPRDPLSIKGLNDFNMYLSQNKPRQAGPQIKLEGKLYGLDQTLLDKYKSNKISFDPKTNPLTGLRYAPALGGAIGLAEGLFSKPDYSRADAVLEAAKEAGNAERVEYNPIGNFLTYNPLDINYTLNNLNAQSGATRRGILNASAGNRAAAVSGLLAADANAQNAVANALRGAQESNIAQRQKVTEFNRATNAMNSEGLLKAAMANQEAGLRGKSSLLSGTLSAMQMKDAIDAARAQSRSANLTNLFDSLGNIGREEVMKSWINENPALYYAISTGGLGVPYKKGKNGGYLTIKNNRRKKNG